MRDHADADYLKRPQQKSAGKRKSKPTLIKGVVESILKQASGESLPVESQLMNAWPALVGASVAEHTRPQKLHQGILFITVDHPAWKMEIQARQGDALLKKIKDNFADACVKQLRFTVGELG